MSQSATTRVMRREVRRLRERPLLLALIVAAPLVTALLVGLVYNHRVVRDLPVALVDADHSDLSRMLGRFVDASPTLKVTERLHSADEVREAMLDGRIEGAFYLPRGLQATVKRGGSGHVVVYRNSANIITGKLLLREGASIVETANVGTLVRKLQAQGHPDETALALARPITYASRTLFNPAVNYENFLPPGIWMMVLQMAVMLSAAVVVNDEYRGGTFGELAEAAEGSWGAVLVGKAVPHLALHSAVALAVVGLVFPLFDVPVHGSLLALIAFLLLFVVASFLPALFLSTWLRDPVQSAEVLVFYTAPAFVFSGYTFPLDAMPQVHQLYAQVMPFTHFLEGFIQLYQYGASPAHAVDEALVLLLAFLLPGLLGTVWMMRRRLGEVTQSAVEGAA